MTKFAPGSRPKSAMPRTEAHAPRAGVVESVTVRSVRFVMGLAFAVVAAAVVGFAVFLRQLPATEIKPSRDADGIVVLTGGSSRVSDAMELLSVGYGKRLLISGVHPTSGALEIQRSLPDSQPLLGCCVDLDHSAVNTRSNATGTRRWVRERGFRSLIVVTSNYHMPRAIVELSHAMPDVALIPFPVVGDKWNDEPWWSSGAAMRLLLLEYAKYVAAEVRVGLDRLGMGSMLASEEPAPAPDLARRSAASVN
jgi:uncharacterized SAM-binding protein YcdF (DUF218 family)